MKPVTKILLVLSIALAACSSSGSGDGSPEPPGGVSGVGSFNAPGVQAIKTGPCPTADELLPAPATGKGALPALDLECIGAEGSSRRVAIARIGRTPSVVNLWASWCKPCVREMPDMEKVHLAGTGKVRFLGVNTDDSVAGARARIVATGVTYPSVADPDEKVRRAVGAPGLPTTLFVDVDGKIVHRQFGPVDEAKLRKLLDEHLGVRL